MPSEAHPLTMASASDIDELNGGVAELKEVPKSDKKLAAEPITEAYVKLSTVQWEWGRRLPKWQRNAVHSMVMREPLLDPSHPLRAPGSKAICLYDVTDGDGCTKVSMSLRQLEYIQYYIHEMRLADPVWTEHLANGHKDQATEADKDVGPPEYPPGEEWVPLPDEFVYGDNVVKVESVYFDDIKELKRYQDKQRSANKKIMTKKMIADDRTFEEARARMLEVKAQADALEQEERRKAQEDNETEGPGLRRGPERHRRRSRRPPRDVDGGNDDGSKGDQTEAKVGWGGFPLVNDEALSNNPKTLADLESLTLGPKIQSSSESEDPDSSAPPSPAIQPISNFTTAYYHHAQQALLIATLGGMFEAQKGLPGYLNEMANLTETAPIGRSLFISLRLITWEADDTTVLEIGWSAIWWQEKLDVAEARSGDDDKIADHLADKANGTWKPNHRNDYQFGDSLPIAAKDAVRPIQEKLVDLSSRAGGGPTYIVLHSTDGTHADPSKIGLVTKDWYTRFKPPHWNFPSYACVDGIGKTFIIDTAILLAAAEHDPVYGPAPIKTRLTMEEAVWLLFNKDDARRPHFCGNAGNDAVVPRILQPRALHLFADGAVITAPSLEQLRADIKTAKAAPRSATPDPVEVSSDDTLVAVPHGQAINRASGESKANGDNHQEELYEEDEDDDYSEDDRIKGVYGYGPDGELIQLD